VIIMADTGLATVLVVIAVGLIIGVYVFTSISPILQQQSVVDENLGNFNYVLLGSKYMAHAPVISGSVSCWNSSAYGTKSAKPAAGGVMTLNTHFTYNKRTGEVSAVGATKLKVVNCSYTYGIGNAAQTVMTSVDSNTYTGFMLGAIVVIVIAAAAILRNLGMI
jgi:hypothetical protein